ncbi:hypothetical protein ACLB2K_046758 [Fragaria x ananassa]
MEEEGEAEREEEGEAEGEEEGEAEGRRRRGSGMRGNWVEERREKRAKKKERLMEEGEAHGRRSIRDYNSLNASAIQMFCSMADSDLLDEARELFKPLSGEVTLPQVAVFTIVISTYANNGNIKDAHKVYQQMIASGVTPTAYTYAALVAGFAVDFSNSDSVWYAKKYFLEMLDRGMKPHSQPYMNLMTFIAYQEPEEEGNKFLEQVQAKGLSLDHYHFPYKEVHRTEQMKVIRICNDLIFSNTNDKDVQKYVLRSCDSAWKIFVLSVNMHNALPEDGNVNEDTIQHALTDPSVLIHTLVIESYLKFGKAKGALEAYWGMLAAGFAPTSYIYTVLIKGLTAHPVFLGDAKKCLLAKKPNAGTYTAVIESFATQGDKGSEECKELVEVMISKGFVPNAKAMREV